MASKDEQLAATNGIDGREQVLRLEQLRLERGYKAGWVYYTCEKRGLLIQYQELKREGLIGDRALREAAAEREPKNANLAADRANAVQLTIELVPSTCWYSNVRSEISRNDWKKLQKTAFDKAHRRCEVCGGRGPRHPVECHEIWHYDDRTHTQTLAGLIALCPSCHEVKHIGLAETRGRKEIAAAHLASVNGWTEAQTATYIDEQFSVWRRRSRFEWHLDISLLESYGISTASEEGDVVGGRNRSASSSASSTRPVTQAPSVPSAGAPSREEAAHGRDDGSSAIITADHSTPSRTSDQQRLPSEPQISTVAAVTSARCDWSALEDVNDAEPHLGRSGMMAVIAIPLLGAVMVLAVGAMLGVVAFMTIGIVVCSLVRSLRLRPAQVFMLLIVVVAMLALAAILVSLSSTPSADDDPETFAFKSAIITARVIT